MIPAISVKRAYFPENNKYIGNKSATYRLREKGMIYTLRKGDKRNCMERTNRDRAYDIVDIFPITDRFDGNKKGRKIGIATKINGVANTHTSLMNAPLMTEDEKAIFNRNFWHLFYNIQALLPSDPKTNIKKGPYYYGPLSSEKGGKLRQHFEKSPRPLSPYTGPADRNSGSDRYPAPFFPPATSPPDTRPVLAVCPVVRPPQPAPQTPDTH